MVFRNGIRMLWNPLKHQPLRFRPEERVRLQVLDYLILQSRIPAARIASESPVPSRFSRGRTDLLCYDNAFQPLLLIECKAENVRLGPKAATQSAVYNRFVKAPYLMLTNGLEDALYHIPSGLESMDEADYPELLPVKKPWFCDDPDYWKERGFLPAALNDSVSKSASRKLALLFQASSETSGYLRFSFPDDPVTHEHYYLLLSASGLSDTLLAVSLIARNRTETVLSAVANRRSRNISCFSATLDTSGEFHNPRIYMAGIDDIVKSDTHEVEVPDLSGLQSFWLKGDSCAAENSPADTDENTASAKPAQNATDDEILFDANREVASSVKLLTEILENILIPR